MLEPRPFGLQSGLWTVPGHPPHLSLGCLSGMDGPTGPEPSTSLCSPWEEVRPCQDRDQGAACS